MGALSALAGEFAIALTDGIANTLRSRKGIRNLALAICVLCFIAAVAIAVNPVLFNLHISVKGPAVAAALVLFYLMVSILLAYTDVKVAAIAGSRQEQSVSYVLGDQLRELGKERKVLEERLSNQSPSEAHQLPGKKEELFDTSLELNLNQLREYYVINKSQARSSFRMGVIAVLLGLMAILVGVGLLYTGGGQKNHLGVAIVTAVAGLLGQFIGGSCFYLFNKAQDQSVHYYNRLTELQGALLAVQLAGSITRTELADETRQQIVFALVKWTPSSMPKPPGRKTGARRKNKELVSSVLSQSPNGPPIVADAPDSS